MRIALIGSKGIPARSGGVERHVEELAVRLARAGHSVIVYGRQSYDLPKKRTYKGVRVLAMPSISTKNLDAITATFLATLHLFFSRYDIIHYHGIGPSSLILLAKILKPRTKIVATFHSRDYEHKKWGRCARWYFRFGEWVTCRFPDITIAVSRSIAHYAKNVYKRQVMYIPNGAVAEFVDIEKVLKKHKVHPKRYIFTASRFIRHKNLHLLIYAFVQLQQNEEYRDWKLVIAGNASEDDAYSEEIRRLAKESENVVLTGEQSAQEIAEWLSNAYLFIQSSSSEGLSLALLEAGAYGVAPLVSDIPENLEAVGNTGFVFHNNDVNDLKAKLVELFKNPDGVQKSGIEFQKRVENTYHWDTIVQKTLHLYKNLL